MIHYLIALGVLAMTWSCSADSMPVVPREVESGKLAVNRTEAVRSPETIPAIDAEAPADYETASFGLG